MNIAFAGLRHDHIFGLAALVKQNSEFQVVGWWEQNDEAHKAGEKTFDVPAYNSFEELVSDQKVDIVAIGDCYGSRGKLVIDALKAGKHVIADKPVCTRIEELDQIESLLQKTGLKLGCMLDLRYEPCLRYLSKMVADGTLGAIKSGAFTGQHPLNWGVRPSWYFKEDMHGGTFNDIAIHGLDAIHFITGSNWQETLYARHWNSFASLAPEFKDSAQCIGELSNGANIMADVSYAAPSPVGFKTPAYWRFTLWGTNGFAECRYGSPEVTVMTTGDSEPRVLLAPPVAGNYLSDLKAEIEGKSVLFDTQSVLQASRTALQLQQFADQKG